MRKEKTVVLMPDILATIMGLLTTELIESKIKSVQPNIARNRIIKKGLKSFVGSTKSPKIAKNRNYLLAGTKINRLQRRD
jgi:hypothetical protein